MKSLKQVLAVVLVLTLFSTVIYAAPGGNGRGNGRANREDKRTEQALLLEQLSVSLVEGLLEQVPTFEGLPYGLAKRGQIDRLPKGLQKLISEGRMPFGLMMQVDKTVRPKPVETPKEDETLIEALEALIEKAEELRDDKVSYVLGEDEGPVGMVTQARYNEFYVAIVEAKASAADEDVTDEALETAIEDLEAAIKTFKLSELQGEGQIAYLGQVLAYLKLVQVQLDSEEDEALNDLIVAIEATQVDGYLLEKGVYLELLDQASDYLSDLKDALLFNLETNLETIIDTLPNPTPENPHVTLVELNAIIDTIQEALKDSESLIISELLAFLEILSEASEAYKAYEVYEATLVQ